VCGIAGSVAFDRVDRDEMLAEVARMVAAVRHRGPDGEGIWRDDDLPVCLGHRRLSIIDLSPSGAQPMESLDGSSIITINGEIYNYVELRQDLEAKGCRFRGTSDTEVLLRAYEAWGIEEALTRARGMFSFAIWDRTRQVLHLARDRAGKKPLYYWRTPTRLSFASEMKALVGQRGIRLTLDQQAMWHYFSLGYVPGPRTIYNEIAEVPPGHRAEVTLAGGLSVVPYWSLPTVRTEAPSMPEAVSQAEHLLSEAVRLRLRADVPVGVFLSGGIDSGLLTALAAATAGEVRTFTVSVPDRTMDEAPMAELVARRYGTRHTVLDVDPDIRSLLPTIAAAYDEPFGDASAIPTYAIAEAASRHVKVVLNGEGGDELFGGYRRHQAMRHLDRLNRLGFGVTRPLVRRGMGLLPSPETPRSSYGLLHRFLRGSAEARNRGELYVNWSTDGFTEDEKLDLFDGSVAHLEPTPAFLSGEVTNPGSSALADILQLDFTSSLADCLLVKLDIASMAHGLEARCPFLDQELIEWSFSLKTRSLVPRGGGKPLLRSMAERYLPEPLVRAPKRGFEIPVQDWLDGPLKDLMWDACIDSSGSLDSLIGQKRLRSFLGKETAMEPARWSRRAWLLLMFAMWDNNANRLSVS
jgi:asparagine synthase (glutamine-hydrolysing)